VQPTPGGDPRVWRRGPIKSTLLVQVRETSEVIPSITYDLAFIRFRINSVIMWREAPQ